MKALSLKQPWAELILIIQGRKVIELRGWKPKFRGEIYIHASRTPDKKYMQEFGFKSLPTESLIGKVNLKDVKEYNSIDEFKKDYKKHLVNHVSFKRYGFIFENPKRIKPVQCKGKLNIFELK